MGTSAFDKLWDEATPKRRVTDGSFDALWGDDPVSPTQAKVRQALKTPEGKRRLERGNREQFEAEMPTLGDYGRNIATNATALASTVAGAIPGVEAVQAKGRSLARGQPYTEALAEIRQTEEEMPAAARIPAKLAGAGLATAALPGSVAMQGARYGVLRGALQADPEKDVGDRATDAALEGTAGLILGKGAELTGTAARGLLSKTPARNLLNRTQARTDASAPAYKAFRDLGELDETPALKDILELPAIRRAVETVKGESPVLAKLVDTDAKVLDAVYKRVGNKAFKAQHGFETDEARAALKSAIEEAAQLKGGSYTAAVDPFAEASRGIEGVKRGAMTLKHAGSPSGGPLSSATKTSPEALEVWSKLVGAPEREAAAEGIAGQLGRSPLLSRAEIAGTRIPLPFPSKALRNAPALLRTVEGDGGLLELLKALGKR